MTDVLAPEGASTIDATLQRVADTARCFGLAMISRAGSGHPGITSGAAELATVLFGEAMVYDPADPTWINRDRLVFSAGHGSALLYSLLHLYCYGVSREDLRQFRSIGSRTPGHPEFRVTPGVEATTGPLGEGFGAGVGMALAETVLAAQFNTDDCRVVDHRTYVVAGDGDLMEGVAQEAISLAGLFGLEKLTVLWDDNGHTSSGPAPATRVEDVRQRFGAARWDVLEADGQDVTSIRRALAMAARTPRPTMIAARTVGGRYLEGREGSYRCHAGTVDLSEATRLADRLEVGAAADFEQPADVRRACLERQAQLSEQRRAWEQLAQSYRRRHPEPYRELTDSDGARARDLGAIVERLARAEESCSPREASIRTVELASDRVSLVNAGIDSLRQFPPKLGTYRQSNRSGRNLNCGVREHGMGALLNGIAFHGGLQAVGSCFMSFSDHLRPSLRLAAMAKLPVLLLAYNDSVLSGPDGPTHQAVEQLPGLRCIPNTVVFRPADAGETAAAIEWAFEHGGVVVVCLSALPTPPLRRSDPRVDYHGIGRGAYEVGTSSSYPDAVVVATGSEVHIALDGKRRLESEGLNVKVVSMPSTTLFSRQPPAWQQQVLGPSSSPLLVVEAGPRYGWDGVVRRPFEMVSADDFGASGAPADLATAYGFTVEHVADRLRGLVTQPRDGAGRRVPPAGVAG